MCFANESNFKKSGKAVQGINQCVNKIISTSSLSEITAHVLGKLEKPKAV